MTIFYIRVNRFVCSNRRTINCVFQDINNNRLVIIININIHTSIIKKKSLLLLLLFIRALLLLLKMIILSQGLQKHRNHRELFRFSTLAEKKASLSTTISGGCDCGVPVHIPPSCRGLSQWQGILSTGKRPNDSEVFTGTADHQFSVEISKESVGI